MALPGHNAEILQSFMAMLGEETYPENNDYPLPAETKHLEEAIAALHSADGRTPTQDPQVPNIDFQMIEDVIRESEQHQVDMMINPQAAIDPASAQQFYFPITDLTPPDEIVQDNAIQNPSMIALATTDTSALQDSQMSPSTTTDISESMSVDPVSPGNGISAQAEGEESMEAAEAKSEDPPKLPDLEELLIRIRYRSKEVERKHIKNSQGCVVFYSRPLMVPQPANKMPDLVQFPDIMPNQRAEMTDSQYTFTVHVLKALEKGLFLRCDQYGNVYATRYCRSKIFWYSTEKGPIAEAQGNTSVQKVTFQKLERNKEVIVFDNMLFQRKLLHYVVNKPTFKNEAAKASANMHTIPISPAIFFTFAQSWNPLNSALSSCLVSMVVNPVRARMQRQWGNEDRHESYDLSNYRLQMSSTDAGEG